MTQIKREKTEVVSLSLPRDLNKTLREYAQEVDLPVSKIARDALRYYIWLNRWQKIQKTFGPAFQKAGIKTDEDVEKYFG